MVLANICSAGAQNVVSNFIIPLTFNSSIATAIIVALAYMFGEAINNPKVVLWAKTEIIQLFISIFSVGLVLQVVSFSCTIDINSIYSIVAPIGSNPQSISMYQAAENYFITGGTYIKDVLEITRYHLGGYNILQSFARNFCLGATTAPLSGFLNLIFCLYGSGILSSASTLGIGTGTYIRPDSGYSFLASGVGVAFNSVLFSYISSLNYLFILRYIYSGLALFLLPLGIFFRAVPYMRTLGSLMISVSLSFVLIFPLVLSVFYLDLSSNTSVLAPRTSPAFNYLGRSISGAGAAAFLGFKDTIYTDVFNQQGNDQSFEVIKLAGNAFLIGVFIPSLALLAAAAAVSYINKFLGEEIDLSRIVQMV